MSQRNEILDYLLNTYNVLNDEAFTANKEMMKYHPKSNTWNEYEEKWKKARLMQDFIRAILTDLGLSYLLNVV